MGLDVTPLYSILYWQEMLEIPGFLWGGGGGTGILIIGSSA